MILPLPKTPIMIPSGTSSIRAVVCSVVQGGDSPIVRIVYKDNYGKVTSDNAHWVDGHWDIPNNGLGGLDASRFPELQEFVDILEFREKST